MTSTTNDFLHQVNANCSIDDIELLAKYIYYRKNGKTKCVNTPISFRDLDNCLKPCFVNNDGSMVSFKDIHVYLKQHLGFSSFMNDPYFVEKYLCDISDNLNVNCTNDVLNEIKSYFSSSDVLHPISIIVRNIFTKLFSLMEDAKYHLSGYICVNNDKFSFLYDLLYQRETITKYHKIISAEISSLIETIKSPKSALGYSGKNAIMYAVVFFALYQRDDTFFKHWKYYFDISDYGFLGVNKKKVDKQYYALKNFAYEMAITLKNFGLKRNSQQEKDPAHHYIYPCIVFIEIFNKAYPVTGVETLNDFFLRYTKGGKITTTATLLSNVFYNTSSDSIEVERIIDTLRYIDLSDSALRSSNSARSRFKDNATLPLNIYRLLLKCWLYYYPNENLDTSVLDIIKPYFSYHFYNEALFYDDKIEELSKKNEDKYKKVSKTTQARKQMNYEFKSWFNNNTPYVSNDFNDREREYFRKPNSKINKNFFDEFYKYEYCYIDNMMDSIKLTSESLGHTIYGKLKIMHDTNQLSLSSYTKSAKKTL